MTMQNIELGDAIRVKHGFAFKGEYFAPEGEMVVLTPGNFFERGGFRARPHKDRFYSGDIPDGYILGKGDLVVAMTEQGPGLLGSSALIPESDRYLHNQRIGLVTVHAQQLLDRNFAYYLFNTRNVRSQINGSATGTKVRHTAPERIYRVKVRVPPISKQKEIVETLSAYDRLISINERRIALLERSARLLFEEWFVRLRYPGHEHDSVTNGLPAEWELKTLGEVSPLIYGKALKEENRFPGDIAVYGSSGEVGSHNQKLACAPGIIVGRKGNVGSVFWSQKDFWAIDTAYYVDPAHVSLFVYHLLRVQTFENSDAAVPGLNRDYAHRKEIKWPSSQLRSAFERQVAPIFQQREILIKSIQRLKQARDLLLPRLMDGRISI
jgi:type I restriction enzyme S subunit